MEKNKTWQILNKSIDYQCKIATINKMDCYLPSKDIHNNFISMELHDWANVFAIDTDNQVIMVKQHRLGADLITIEVPAGTLDYNEDPKTAAIRELEEETGYSPGEIVLLKSILVNPAIQTNRCYFFLATNCKKTKEISLDDTEEIDILKYDLHYIFDSRNNDLIENSITLLSIMLAKDYILQHKTEVSQ
ncbi:MAG: hypothetical protein A2015_17405 [Spirochaetes bacterium GWF1_31_7]|nr:MAG: hypothetical protein A2Y30_05395 [Spirochaetes bacterium GWE1_32_154]OHD46230.1 MAG: hypothetical protein A2Y29_08400 [Spirochaetes bacterium GWE2_31_10]OHD48600.1 MAG: hypothetical protein A2015_17405 [Spirochaetes bacterium GWF1_31_7]OHD81652.1 MAG: hypothetical protein A2355_03720 [Spirochaetes bacterium RIFOXYB1_FULL_32_8]HBD93047.1 NTP pyrophosphohydrolase [Spirochaetia bacterium]